MRPKSLPCLCDSDTSPGGPDPTLQVLQRAGAAGVSVCVAWTSDCEKEGAVLRLARENAGAREGHETSLKSSNLAP